MLPSHNTQGPHVVIVEQPAPKALRFRYECEGRLAGSIPGISSKGDGNKTFPSIRIVGYQGRAVVVVSCVTKDEPYKAHPHNLVGRECKKGVCTMKIPPDTMCLSFTNIGIQCVKKKEVEKALRVREEIKVDPFKAGFDHRDQPTSIDLNVVRLCFQVFLEDKNTRNYTIALKPVVSDPIYDKKAMSDLAIVKLSDCNSYVDGSRKDIILLCEKVTKEDIQIRFYEEQNGNVIWEALGDFQPSQVHKQTAIWFRAPRYKTVEITEPVRVNIQLYRPSDGAASEPLPFEYLPLDSVTSRKRRRFDDINAQLRLEQYDTSKGKPLWNIPMDAIKIEPRDKTPSPYGGNVYGAGLSPNSQGVSPQYLGATPPPPDMQYQMNLSSASALPQNWLSDQNPIQQILQQPLHTPMQPQLPQPIQPLLQESLQQEPMLISSGGLGGSNLIRLLNLDSQQAELKPLNLNSGDLAFDTNNLSESFNTNLSLTDLEQPKENIDSLNGFVNGELERMLNH